MSTDVGGEEQERTEGKNIHKRIAWWSVAAIIAAVGVLFAEAHDSNWTGALWFATGLCMSRSWYWTGHRDAHATPPPGGEGT